MLIQIFMFSVIKEMSCDLDVEFDKKSRVLEFSLLNILYFKATGWTFHNV